MDKKQIIDEFPRDVPPAYEEVKIYFNQKGMPEPEAQCFFLFYESKSGNFYKSWKPIAYAWIRTFIASYYVLSGNDFTLDINNPEKPKIVCVGNNPSKQQTYGAVLSLYIERMLKLVNRKGQLKSSLIFDEYPTIYADIGPTISTGRSNLVACTVCVQDISQLRKDYGKEQAEVIMNVAGNIISGQVLGDSARILSDRIGKIMQERESISINSNDTSLSKSTQLESAIPPSKIANLSSGQFVGAVADTPAQKIKLKAFHNEVLIDHAAIKKEEDGYQDLPLIRNINNDVVMENYFRIKNDIRNLVKSESAKVKGLKKENTKPERPRPDANNISL